jgi:hypothetical protein
VNTRNVVLAERALAAIFGLFFIATLLAPDWIELLTDVDPDAGSGALEWGITFVFLLCAVGSAAAAAFHAPRLRNDSRT